MPRDDPPFINHRSPSRPPPLPGSWDAVRLEMRNQALVAGIWEGKLSMVLQAADKGGFSGHANAAAKAKARGITTTQEFLLQWLKRSRLAWSMDEAEDRLTLTMKTPPQPRGPALKPVHQLDGSLQPGLFESESE